ncbi:serine/threonine-protein kinase [Nonomuraea fuscirosea]|uniref:serine/threonine-protein kinase n=1 Tax=Nonomuraea fuscirosea TaxID=1291556 RepID=UPI0034317F0A
MHVVAGRYHLVAPLGAGGAGTVWRAHDAVLRREVAVKQVRLPSDPARTDKALADTLREARAAAALNHPAIITVHDVIAEQGQPWIVMDLLAGRSLADLIRESGRLPAGQVATIGLRVLDALDAAHRRGILHRDVKPGNVIITDAGEAILTDFGIAAQIDPRTDPQISAQAEQSGTPGYVAPERLRGEPTGPASDHWSLAATLYTAVEGQSPFRRDTPMAMVAAVLTQPPLPAAHAGPIGGLLMALLDKNPAARPPLSVIKDVLGPIAAPLPARRPVGGPTTPARPPTDPSSGIATMPVTRTRSRLPLVLAALTAATAVTVSVVLLVNASNGTTPPPETRPIAQPSNGPSNEPSNGPSGEPPSSPPPSPAATTTASPRAPGDGKFATAPSACGLVSEDQAAKIIPGLAKRQSGMDPAECGWNGGEDVITVKVTRSATVAAARKVFGGRKDAQASKTGSSGGTTYQAVRDLPGVGDGAFGQNWYATTFIQTHSVVWLRVSNVVVQIDAATFNESKPQAKHQNWALKLAGAAADTLRNTSPQDAG